MASNPVNIFEYEEIARTRIERGDYDFIAGGATDELTIRRTRAVFDSIMMRPSMLTDVSHRDLSTTVLGQEIAFPIMLDPAGNHGAAHPEAEIASVKAAGRAGTLMVLSSHASRTLEDVADAATGPLWFQQYFFKDRELTLEMAARAEEAGFSAICITVDARSNPSGSATSGTITWDPRLPTTPSWTWALTPGSLAQTLRRVPATFATRPPPGTTWIGWPLTALAPGGKGGDGR